MQTRKPEIIARLRLVHGHFLRRAIDSSLCAVCKRLGLAMKRLKYFFYWLRCGFSIRRAWHFSLPFSKLRK